MNTCTVVDGCVLHACFLNHVEKTAETAVALGAKVTNVCPCVFVASGSDFSSASHRVC